mmetsp:Transcript_21608/g.48653  ORF Transcript_21608/g.48653 Transcript_21608/m.48653 type:complete len:301 (-) Transcript_21608:740-1642(-)
MFRIFPRNGKIAWKTTAPMSAAHLIITPLVLLHPTHPALPRAKRRLQHPTWKSRFLPCFADPPALSPSTMKTSDSDGTLLEQSASLPGNTDEPRTLLRRTRSRAALAASAAFAADIAFSTIAASTFGRRCSSAVRNSAVTSLTMPRTSGLPNRFFVCPSNSASCILTLTIAHNPSLMKSPAKLADLSFSLPEIRACAFSTRVSADFNPSVCVPPLAVCTPFAKLIIESEYMSEFQRSAISTITLRTVRLVKKTDGSSTSAVFPSQIVSTYSLMPPRWQNISSRNGAKRSSTSSIFNPAFK